MDQDAYNLLNWFRLTMLPDNISKYEIPSLRRLILNVPGNIVGNGRYRHIKLAPNNWLKEVIHTIKNKLNDFLSQKILLLVDSS